MIRIKDFRRIRIDTLLDKERLLRFVAKSNENCKQRFNAPPEKSLTKYAILFNKFGKALIHIRSHRIAPLKKELTSLTIAHR